MSTSDASYASVAGNGGSDNPPQPASEQSIRLPRDTVSLQIVNSAYRRFLVDDALDSTPPFLLDLLSDDNRAVLASVRHALSPAAQGLLLRLYLRRDAPVPLASVVRYPEVAACTAGARLAVDELLRRGLAYPLSALRRTKPAVRRRGSAASKAPTRSDATSHSQGAAAAGVRASADVPSGRSGQPSGGSPLARAGDATAGKSSSASVDGAGAGTERQAKRTRAKQPTGPAKRQVSIKSLFGAALPPSHSAAAKAGELRGGAALLRRADPRITFAEWPRDADGDTPAVQPSPKAPSRLLPKSSFPDVVPPHQHRSAQDMAAEIAAALPASALAAVASGATPTSSAVADGTRAEAEASLVSRLSTQTTLFSASCPIVSHACDALLAKVHEPGPALRESSRSALLCCLPDAEADPTVADAFQPQAPLADSLLPARAHACVRLTPRVRASLRLLVLLHCPVVSTGATSSGGQASALGTAVRHARAWGEGRTRVPLAAWFAPAPRGLHGLTIAPQHSPPAGLLQRFGIVAFPPCTVDPPLQLFPSRHHFLAYAHALSIRSQAAALEAARDEARRSARAAAAGPSPDAAAPSPSSPGTTPAAPAESPDAGAGGRADAAAASRRRLVGGVARDAGVLQAAEVEAADPTVKLDSEARAAWEAFMGVLRGATPWWADWCMWPTTASSNGYAPPPLDDGALLSGLGDSPSAAAVALRASACLAAYAGVRAEVTDIAVLTAPWEHADARAAAGRPRLPSPVHPESSLGRRMRAPVPSWTAPLDAAWVLASLAWDGVAALERAGATACACVLLTLLLRLPCTPHRRGRFWTRLCVDLATLGLARQARLAAASSALDDRLSEGDWTELRRRSRRLCRLARVPVPGWAERAWDSAAASAAGDIDSAAPGANRHASRLSGPVVPEECLVGDGSGVPDAVRAFLRGPGSDAGAVPCVTVLARPLNRQTGDRSRFVGFDDAVTSVEGLVLQLYGREGGWEGAHCEGSLVRPLLLLLLWEAVFAPLPAAFVCPYQDGPLDIDAPASFASRRETALVSRLRALRSMRASELAADVGRRFDAYARYRVRHSAARAASRGALQAVACAIGSAALAALCAAWARDPKHLSGGLPDLLLWRAQDRRSGRLLPLGLSRPSERDPWDVASETAARFEDAAWVDSIVWRARAVEVKGPRDRLSEKQRAWLRVLSRSGLPAEVCRVRERGAGQSGGTVQLDMVF